jgi:hypothetical protein
MIHGAHQGIRSALVSRAIRKGSPSAVLCECFFQPNDQNTAEYKK